MALHVTGVACGGKTKTGRGQKKKIEEVRPSRTPPAKWMAAPKEKWGVFPHDFWGVCYKWKQ